MSRRSFFLFHEGTPGSTIRDPSLIRPLPDSLYSRLTMSCRRSLSQQSRPWNYYKIISGTTGHFTQNTLRRFLPLVVEVSDLIPGATSQTPWGSPRHSDLSSLVPYRLPSRVPGPRTLPETKRKLHTFRNPLELPRLNPTVRPVSHPIPTPLCSCRCSSDVEYPVFPVLSRAHHYCHS